MTWPAPGTPHPPETNEMQLYPTVPTAPCILASVLLTMAATLAPPTAQAEMRDPEQAAAVLERFIDSSTILVGRADVSRIDPQAVFDELERVFGHADLPDRERQLILDMLPAQAERAAVAAWLTSLTDAGVRELYAIVSVADVLATGEPIFFVLAPLTDTVDGERVQQLFDDLVADRPLLPAWTTAVIQNTVILAPRPTMQRLHDHDGHARPALPQAFAAVQDMPVQVLMVPVETTRRILGEMTPPLPDGTRPGPALERIRWLAIGLDLPPDLGLRLRIEADDADAARMLAELAKQLNALLQREAERHAQLQPFATLLANLILTVDDFQLRADPDADAVHRQIVAASRAMLHARVERTHAQSRTQLRGIHQAMVMWSAGQQPREGDRDRPMPSEPGILLLGDYFTAEYVLHPISPTTVPDDFRDWPAERRRAWVNENASYVIVPGLVDDMDTQRVAAFENPEATGGQHISVVFNNNHVQTMPVDEARATIEQQTGMTLEQLAERQAQAGRDDAPRPNAED